MRVRLLKLVDATAGFFLCWLGGHLLHLRNRTVPGDTVDRDVKRILVIRPGGMGDMILMVPMLRSLRQHYPSATIDLVCEQRNREIPVLAGDPATLLLYDAHPLRTVLQLLRGHYDLAIDTEQFHNFSAVMAWMSRAPIRIGFKINPVRNPIYTHLVNYDLEGYEAGEFMRLLTPLGIREKAGEGCPGSRGMSLASRVSGCVSVDDELLPSGSGHVTRDAQRETPLILIHVSASTRYKRWAPEKFAELAGRLCSATQATSLGSRVSSLGSRVAGLESRGEGRGAGDEDSRPLNTGPATRDPGHETFPLNTGPATRDPGHETFPRIGLLGGKRDKALAGEIARQSGLGDRITVYAGEATLADTAALIRQAALFIGGDSGLAHLAVALGTPVVTLFGPSDPMKWGVRNARSAVVRKDLSCSPCFIFGYHKLCHSIACMAEIGVDDVMKAVAEVQAPAG